MPLIKRIRRWLSTTDERQVEKILEVFVPSKLKKVAVVGSKYSDTFGVLLKQQSVGKVSATCYHMVCLECDLHLEACGDDAVETIKADYRDHECDP